MLEVATWTYLQFRIDPDLMFALGFLTNSLGLSALAAARGRRLQQVGVHSRRLVPRRAYSHAVPAVPQEVEWHA